MAKGVIIFAIISFVFGATMFSLMLYTLIREEQLQSTIDYNLNIEKYNHLHVFKLNLDKKSIDFIVSLLLMLSSLIMIFSVILIIGIKKNKPCLVVSYFSFGSFFCLLLVVGAVLVMLQGLWRPAVATFAFAVVYMECLSKVYNFYEKMEMEIDSNLLLDEECNEVSEVSFDNVVCD